jgi:hypothetical protein
MAIYPTGILDATNEADKIIMDKSLRWLEKKGTMAWCGYSFSWAACLYARANEGDNAAKMLGIFASNFVSTNSFHLNGDQRVDNIPALHIAHLHWKEILRLHRVFMKCSFKPKMAV